MGINKTNLMKKIKWLWIPAISLVLAGPVFTSCNDDDEKEETENKGDNNDDNNHPDDNKPVENMTSAQQKEKMETTAINFLNQTKAMDFQNISDLAHYVNDYYVEGNYDNTIVEDWFEACVDAVTGEQLGESTETKKGWSWVDIYHYTNFKKIYFASNFTGHFEAKNGGWTSSKANDLQFTFNDSNGKRCVLTLTTSGKSKNVHLFDIEDWKYDEKYWTETDENGKTIYYYPEYLDRTKYIIGVPERITVTLTQDGQTIVSTVVTTDLSSMSGEDYDLSKDSYTATADVTVGEYRWTADKVSYRSQRDASVSFSMKKGGQVIYSLKASAEGKGDNDNLDELKSVQLSMDILGEMQIQGTCSNGVQFSEYLDHAYDNDRDESRFKSYINMANDLLDLGVYYDGNSKRQAQVKLESFQEEDYYDNYRYWECEPVIYFSDGTTYSTFEAFFNDSDFKKLVNTFENLFDDFDLLIGDFFEDEDDEYWK